MITSDFHKSVFNMQIWPLWMIILCYEQTWFIFIVWNQWGQALKLKISQYYFILWIYSPKKVVKDQSWKKHWSEINKLISETMGYFALETICPQSHVTQDEGHIFGKVLASIPMQINLFIWSMSERPY